MTIDPADRAAVVAFIRSEGRGVIATVDALGHPEAALIVIAALDDGTLIFDSPTDSRKVPNLAGNADVAIVIGTTGDVSLQLEGSAWTASGAERVTYGEAYNAQFPGSRALQDDFSVVAVDVAWLRLYDASSTPGTVREARWR